MKKRLIGAVTVIALLAGSVGSIFPFGGDLKQARAARRPDVSAESAIVMDVQSGTILYEKNIDKREYPASITKIMTTLVALENSSLDETVTFSNNAVELIQGQGASNIEIVPGPGFR